MPTVLSIEDHGMWRGRHTWTVRLEDANGCAQVSAQGETEEQAVANATETFIHRRIWTDEERATLRRTNEALRRGLS